MTVLLDNTVLSNFSIVCRPDLVRLALAEQVGAIEQALQEMQEGVAIDKIPACDRDWLARVILTPAEQPHFETLHECLGAGEASSLAVAQERGYRLATDDKDARRLARQLGISLTGTIGILGMLVRKDEISLIEGDRLLREMVAAGYHSPVSTLEDVLSQ